MNIIIEILFIPISIFAVGAGFASIILFSELYNLRKEILENEKEIKIQKEYWLNFKFAVLKRLDNLEKRSKKNKR